MDLLIFVFAVFVGIIIGYVLSGEYRAYGGERVPLVHYDLANRLVHVKGLNPDMPVAQTGAILQPKFLLDGEQLALVFDRYVGGVVYDRKLAADHAAVLMNYANTDQPGDFLIEDFFDFE